MQFVIVDLVFFIQFLANERLFSIFFIQTSVQTKRSFKNFGKLSMKSSIFFATSASVGLDGKSVVSEDMIMFPKIIHGVSSRLDPSHR